jgi:hypothetical protein
MSTDEKLRAFRDEHLKFKASHYDFLLDMCDDSPIERLFLAAAMSFGWRDCAGAEFIEMFKDLESLHSIRSEQYRRGLRNDSNSLYFLVQPSLRSDEASMRPDFAFATSVAPSARIAVELDGHDFHERTRTQARRDKRKDRDMLAAGWPVIRFTGSEVYENAEACVSEAFGLLPGRQ